MGFTLNQLEQERQIRKLQKKEDKDTSNYEQLSNLPKINNVELKGDKTTSDLGINADNVMMSDGVTSVEGAITSIGSVLYEYTAGANETWSSALDHLYGHTGLNTAILTPNIGIIFMPSVLDRFGAIYLNSNGKLITAAIHMKQSGSMYRENAADSTTVSDLGASTFTQGYKMQVIKLY